MPDRKPDATNAATELSPVKRALLEIRNLRARVEELESAKHMSSQSSEHEPIAIIGVGLRFPGGVTDETSFWNLLAQGKDAITEIPRERWDWRAYYDPDPDAAGSMYTQHGGFLDGVDLFDAAFFGISPREAVAMDPQHRLALEVGWEALENAGYSPTAFQGSSTGVFLGIANGDYGRSAMTDLDRIDAYTGSGNSQGMVAGRLTIAGHRHSLFVVAGGGSPCLHESASGGMQRGSGGRRESDSFAGIQCCAFESTHDGPRWPLQNLR
jgi:hypothetical protein